MTFQEFKTELKDFIIFSIRDIKKVDNTFRRALLNDWQTKGYIKKIRRGFYIFSDIKIQERDLFFIANHIYEPSYISLEMALSRYNLIPESVYGITSISTKKTNNFKTTIGTFIYKNIKPELFFGYTLQKINNTSDRVYKIADIEKTMLDFIYLHKDLSSIDDFDGLRINKDEWREQADMSKFAEYTKAFKSKAFSKRVEVFLEYLKLL